MKKTRKFLFDTISTKTFSRSCCNEIPVFGQYRSLQPGQGEGAEPILEFKGTVRYVEKGHPTLVTYVDLILQT